MCIEQRYLIEMTSTLRHRPRMNDFEKVIVLYFVANVLLMNHNVLSAATTIFQYGHSDLWERVYMYIIFIGSL